MRKKHFAKILVGCLLCLLIAVDDFSVSKTFANKVPSIEKNFCEKSDKSLLDPMEYVLGKLKNYDLVLQRHMIMHYPEYNKVVSRLRCPRLTVADTFVLYGICLPADCGAGDTELSHWYRCKPVIEPMVENSELLPMLMPQSELVLPSDTKCPAFFSLRSA